MALQLDMDTLRSCQIDMTVLIPKDVKASSIEIVTETAEANGDAEVYDSLEMIYDKKEVSLQVQGILSMQTANYKGTDEIFIPYEVMKTEMEKYSDSPFLEDSVLKISGAYMLFNDDVGQLNYELTQKIANIGLTASRDAHRQILSQNQAAYKQTISSLMLGALIAVAVAIIIFSFLYERSFKKDRVLFKTRRQSSLKIRRFIFADILRESLFTTLFGSLTFVFLLYEATSYGYIDNFGAPHQLIGYAALVGLALVFSALSHLVSLTKR